MRRIESKFATVAWSADGSQVTKTFHDYGDEDHVFDRSRFDYERRVNLLLLRHPPSVPFPRLLRSDKRTQTLTFEAVDGDLVGPKYPLELSGRTVDELGAMAWRLPRRVSSCRWLRRFSMSTRLDAAVKAGWLVPADAAKIRAVVLGHPMAHQLAHGDLTARNVVSSHRGLVLIDWEWAGLYPPGYDAAFLWFSLLDVPGARERVASSVPERAETWFWLSALAIQLLHLRLILPRGDLAHFHARHLETRDELVARVLALGAPNPS
jgi:hypothetical protein